MATRIKPTPNSPTKIQLARISHVYVRHSHPDKFLEFANDFGFVEEARIEGAVYLRGYGIDPYCYVVLPSTGGESSFEGGAYVVQSKDDLAKALEFPGATHKDLSHLPGGGEMVTLAAPSGTQVHLVWGQEARSAPVTEPSAQALKIGPYNLPLTKHRKGEFQRFQAGPAMIHKLGHYGNMSSTFDEDMAFFLDNFNLTPTDVLFEPAQPELDVLAFLHIDLGAEYSDHHTFFIQRAEPCHKTKVHHCSFEVTDFDTQLLGHQWLADKGYTSVWGVGRHILGSQIFDYWKDTSGFKIEHYADGDVVNEKTEMCRLAAGPDSLSIWGPPLPATFIS